MSTDRTEIRLVPAVGTAQEEAERLLTDAGLPTGDLEDTALQVALDEEGFRVGVGGIEPHPPVGLLRSVAVREDRRGEGIGEEIVRALEREARQAGLDELYLLTGHSAPRSQSEVVCRSQGSRLPTSRLTTSAEEFFESLGYERVDREDVPPEIRGSTQFSEVCPTSATVLRKAL